MQRWIKDGRVRVNGEPCRPSDDVRSGDVVEVEPAAPPPSTVEPDATVPFEVLYEDEHVVVVNKPAGVVVHPGRGNWTHTLVAGLLSRSGFERAPFDERDPMGPLRPGIVHRLDKNTSGVLVVAKKEAAREHLKKQLAAHTVERVYRAITLGVPKPGRIATLYGRNRSSRLRFTTKVREGRTAITHVAVDEVLVRGAAALVHCRLETGRTHQIRVHLSECAATPVFADATYGRKPSSDGLRAVAEELRRQALHAAVLAFEHPATGETMRFEAPLPADMSRALDALRALP